MWQRNRYSRFMKNKKNSSYASNILSCISIDNPRNAEAYNSIPKNIPLLRQDSRMKKKTTLAANKIIKYKRQLKNLLTSDKLPATNQTPTVKKCGRFNLY